MVHDGIGHRLPRPAGVHEFAKTVRRMDALYGTRLAVGARRMRRLLLPALYRSEPHAFPHRPPAPQESDSVGGNRRSHPFQHQEQTDVAPLRRRRFRRFLGMVFRFRHRPFLSLCDAARHPAFDSVEIRPQILGFVRRPRQNGPFHPTLPIPRATNQATSSGDERDGGSMTDGLKERFEWTAH